MSKTYCNSLHHPVAEAQNDETKVGQLSCWQIFKHALSEPAPSDILDTIQVLEAWQYPCVKEAYDLTLAYWNNKFGVKRSWEHEEDSKVGYCTGIYFLWTPLDHV